MIVTAALHAFTIWLSVLAYLLACGGPAGHALLATPLAVSALTGLLLAASMALDVESGHVRDRDQN